MFVSRVRVPSANGDTDIRWAIAHDTHEAPRLVRDAHTTQADLFEALCADEEVALAEDPVDPGAIAYEVPSAPTKIICVGLNYQHHAEEMDKQIPEEPLLFMKPPSALLAHEGEVVLPPQSQLVHHEGELAMVIGRRARRVERAEALGYVLGYTTAIDVSARDIQRREGKYTRGKGFDTFCPVGPRVRLGWEGWRPTDEVLTLEVNGEQRQRSRVDDLIFDLDEIVSFISHVMTLEPGDMILTGTPAGVGPIEDGDRVEVAIEGVGRLRVTGRRNMVISSIV